VDGGENYGRVIVDVDNEAGAVCDNRWGTSEATVVCRSMGYKAGEPMVYVLCNM
jgi:hypothetical protein